MDFSQCTEANMWLANGGHSAQALDRGYVQAFVHNGYKIELRKVNGFYLVQVTFRDEHGDLLAETHYMIWNKLENARKDYAMAVKAVLS